MTARVATGRAVKPTLVRGVGERLVPLAEPGNVEVDPEHLQLVRDGMNAVVNEAGGTARRARLENKETLLAGKTGTSQVASLQRDPKTGRILKNEESVSYTHLTLPTIYSV